MVLTFRVMRGCFIILCLLSFVSCDYEDTTGMYWQISAGITEVPTDIPSEAVRVLLTYNQITDIRPGAFADLSACVELDLDGNGVTEIRQDMWEGLVSLQRLGLYGNEIQTVEPGAFSLLTNLNSLGLSHNRLNEIREDMLQGLEGILKLYLSDNSLTSIKPGTFRRLTSCEILHLSGNPLNHISSEMFQGLQALKVLGLANTGIRDLPSGVFENLGNLESLFLSRNNLTVIRPDMLIGLASLKELQLDENQIHLVQAGSFSILNHPKLDILELQYNSLTTISEDIFDPESPNSKPHPDWFRLHILGNPLECNDEEICWLMPWFKLNPWGYEACLNYCENLD